MDPGSIVIAAVAAVAAGASAIIAWAARADSIKAADRAAQAESSALRAWEQTAEALRTANVQRAEQHAARLDRERRLRRTEVAEHFRAWFIEEAVRIETGEETTPSQKAEGRDVSIRLRASGEPGAKELELDVRGEIAGVKLQDTQSFVESVVEIDTLVLRWVDDPAVFKREHFRKTMELLRTDISAQQAPTADALRAMEEPPSAR